MGAAIPVWIAAGCNRVLGQKFTEDAERLHGGLVSAAKGRALGY